METKLNKNIKNAIKQAEIFCSEQELQVVFTYTISNTTLDTISERTQKLPSMYFANKEMLLERLKNGCFLIKKGNKVYGHIFAHKHQIHKHSVFERSSLWIHSEYRNKNLGLLLMNLLTKRYDKDFLISIAQEPAVHSNNELLGMKHISLPELSPRLIETLEKIGKLRDEHKFKYYVNPYFELKIKQFNKILSNINKNI